MMTFIGTAGLLLIFCFFYKTVAEIVYNPKDGSSMDWGTEKRSKMFFMATLWPVFVPWWAAKKLWWWLTVGSLIVVATVCKHLRNLI